MRHLGHAEAHYLAGLGHTYASEAYGLLSRDFIGTNDNTKVDWGQLEADMADLQAEAAA